MNKGIPYITRFKICLQMGDIDGAQKVLSEGIGDITSELVSLIQQYRRNDLPFIVAAMKIVTNAMAPVVGEGGMKFVDEVVNNTESITIVLNPDRE